MAYKSGNPALNTETFDDPPAPPHGARGVMTLDGVAGKSLMLLVSCVAGGAYGWHLAVQDHEYLMILLYGSLFAALAVAILTVFKKHLARFTAPLYAVLEGFALGIISQMLEAVMDGIVLQALLLTGGIFVSMLALYLFRIIRATENLKLGVAAATGGIALYYVANLFVNFLGIDLPLISSTSVWGILFTVAVIVVAALNLVVDFDFIEKGAESKAPKYMEWYASFGLFVTIVWLYLELLRLLGKIRGR